MIPYRCLNPKGKGSRVGKVCAKRKSMRWKQEPSEVKCPGCGSKFHWWEDKYRVAGRKKPNKDNAPRCDCNGVKSKKQDKIQYHGGVRIVAGVHRRGQRGCIHHPDFGIPEFDMFDEPPPPLVDEPVPF